ncbi:MAG: hypothetical protein ACFB22_08795 [Rhodothalassiaceae bacterium]
MQSTLIEVALGLALIYLVLSLSVTSLNEVIETLGELRGKQLRAKLREVFGGQAEELMQDPLLKSLSRKNLPSYIPSRLFGEAMTVRLRSAVARAAAAKQQFQDGVQTAEAVHQVIEDSVKTLPPDLQGYAQRILERAEGGGLAYVRDVERRIAAHYEDMMDRATGAFVRTVQRNSAIIALALVLLANADTIRIANRLMADGALRSGLADAAVSVAVAQPQVQPADGPEDAAVPPSPGDTAAAADAAASTALPNLSGLQAEIASFPLGWDCPNHHDLIGWPNLACNDNDLWDYVLVGFGWLLSTLAIMLGAPFWFNVLQRVGNIRGTGKKPQR